MARYVMTARRKAALRKAQIASAAKRRKNRALSRRGLTKSGRASFKKAIRKNPRKAIVRFGVAVFIGASTGKALANGITNSKKFADVTRKRRIRRQAKKIINNQKKRFV